MEGFGPDRPASGDLDAGWRTGRWVVPCLDHLWRRQLIEVTVRGPRIALYLPDPYLVWVSRYSGDQLASALLKAGTAAQLFGGAA